MDDLIRRQDAINAIDNLPYEFNDGLTWCVRMDIYKAIYNQPSAQSERGTGEWILADEQREEDVQNGNYRYICSCCGSSDLHAKTQEVPYCWYCGSRMKG